MLIEPAVCRVDNDDVWPDFESETDEGYLSADEQSTLPLVMPAAGPTAAGSDGPVAMDTEPITIEPPSQPDHQQLVASQAAHGDVPAAQPGLHGAVAPGPVRDLGSTSLAELHSELSRTAGVVTAQVSQTNSACSCLHLAADKYAYPRSCMCTLCLKSVGSSGPLVLAMLSDGLASLAQIVVDLDQFHVASV
jgi:hypothetical protein